MKNKNTNNKIDEKARYWLESFMNNADNIFEGLFPDSAASVMEQIEKQEAEQVKVWLDNQVINAAAVFDHTFPYFEKEVQRQIDSVEAGGSGADETTDRIEINQEPMEVDDKSATTEIPRVEEVRAVSGRTMHRDLFYNRLGQSWYEKWIIAVFVADMLNRDYRGEAIVIDGGTTNSAIAVALGYQALAGQNTIPLIVTNNILIPELVSRGPRPPAVRLTGGLYRADRRTIVDPDVITVCQKYGFAASVVGINSFKYPCLYTTTGTENTVKEAFMGPAGHIIFPIDASKWGEKAGMKMKRLEELICKDKQVTIVTAYPMETSTETLGQCLLYRERLAEEMNQLLKGGVQ